MSKLSAPGRKKLPTEDFAGPNKSYPIEDKAHARNAKARATQADKAGRMSESKKENIDCKADKVLKGKGK